MGYSNRNYHTPSKSLGGGNGDSSSTTFLIDLPFLASGQRMLAYDSVLDAVVYADHSELQHAQHVLGFTKTAGDTAVPVITEGYYEDPTMSWDPLLPLWLGTTGFLVQVRPTTGFIMQVGRVLAPTKIIIQIQPAVILS